jgi:ATP-dependent Clp protease protease subunit
MTQFSKRDAAKIAARQATEETDRIIRDARGTADRLGSLTVDEENAVIWLDGEIGEDYWGGVDAATVRDAMRSLKGRQVTFRINSGGGSVDQGLEIYTILKEHPGGVITRGNLIASMAGIVFQAGTQRIMEQTGTLMIHGPRLVGGGDAAEHVKYAQKLQKYAERAVPIFAQRSGKSEYAIRQLFEGEHWYTPAEAVAEGFADSVAGRSTTGRPKIAAAIRQSIRLKSEALKMDWNHIIACADN